ncbi:unnamed protein product [Rhizophagus irregularis]|nr:unnamed protein product [Rhizophagus irregularis]
MGILRSCMAGEAAEWFDREITGKNWELSSINSAGGANLAAFVALVIPEGAGGPNAGGDKAWGRAGARPTDRAAPATADAGVAAANNHPIVFPAERFSNLNPDDLVKHLRNLERRRAEMRLGLQDRNRRLQADYSDVTQPPLGKQEPVVLTSKSSGVTQEQLQELLKAQAEELTKNFQMQFKQLQARPVRNPPVYRQQIKPVRLKPPRRVVQDHQDPDWDDGYVEHDVGDDPDAPEWTLDDHQNAIDLIMGYKRGTSKILTNQLQKTKDRRDDLDLARAMRNLDLNDDAMDIDTVSFGEKVELREKDGDVYMVRVGSKKK